MRGHEWICLNVTVTREHADAQVPIVFGDTARLGDV
jgi:hypothetical protein